MKALKELFLVDHKLGFIPFFIGVFVFRLLTTQVYVFTALSDFNMYGNQQDYLVYTDYFKLTFAHLSYPVWITVLSVVLLRIKGLKLIHFLGLIFLVDFIFNMGILYLASGDIMFSIALNNSLTHAFLFGLYVFIRKQKKSIFFGIVLGLWLSDMFGFCVALVFDWLSEMTLFYPRVEWFYLELDRIISALISGLVFIGGFHFFRSNEKSIS